MQDTLENISLKHDNGEDMRFRGSLSSECSWYDEEHGVLCRQKLYVTENKDQIYYIMRTGAEEHSRRAYRLKVQDQTCIIHNGKAEVRMPITLLMLAVRGLCGMDARPCHGGRNAQGCQRLAAVRFFPEKRGKGCFFGSIPFRFCGLCSCTGHTNQKSHPYGWLF